MIRAGHNIVGCRVTILGITFKEDCPDVRNTRVVDIIAELKEYGVEVQVCDPQADPQETLHEYGVTLTPFKSLKPAVAVVVAVAHAEFRELTVTNVCHLTYGNPVLVDVKGIYDRAAFQAKGVRVWRL
jgi:UDP-N-acetyl-D-galactosamine dehydrogenase